ncbi:hypothetical protein [Amycolatopsis nigrescens]|uniref:hypothetical protein n=1 Tax=Amycolatopsis nigrescens TaxID=381445 RepID=UPI0012FB82A4|nr:hypothetical protein [Amycolatopsis nigrescens]
MAKFRCVCGQLISTSGEIPNPIEWHCISDVNLGRLVDDGTADDVYHASTIFYRCPASDHLWVFWDGIDKSPSLYSPTPKTNFEPEGIIEEHPES